MNQPWPEIGFAKKGKRRINQADGRLPLSMMALAFVLGGLTIFVALNALFWIKDAKIARSRVGYGANDFLEYFSKQQCPDK